MRNISRSHSLRACALAAKAGLAACLGRGTRMADTLPRSNCCSGSAGVGGNFSAAARRAVRVLDPHEMPVEPARGWQVKAPHGVRPSMSPIDTRQGSVLWAPAIQSTTKEIALVSRTRGIPIGLRHFWEKKFTDLQASLLGNTMMQIPEHRWRPGIVAVAATKMLARRASFSSTTTVSRTGTLATSASLSSPDQRHDHRSPTAERDCA
jgi:hypothetical protein